MRLSPRILVRLRESSLLSLYEEAIVNASRGCILWRLQLWRSKVVKVTWKTHVLGEQSGVLRSEPFECSHPAMPHINTFCRIECQRGAQFVSKQIQGIDVTCLSDLQALAKCDLARIGNSEDIRFGSVASRACKQQIRVLTNQVRLS